MSTNYIPAFLGLLVFAIGLTFVVARRRANRQLSEFRSLSQAVSQTRQALDESEQELSKSRDVYARIFADTVKLRELRQNADDVARQLQTDTDLLREAKEKLSAVSGELEARNAELQDLMSKMDLYSFQEELVEYGHFESPEYLHETSDEFAGEIRRVRELQKGLIKSREAILYPPSLSFAVDSSRERKILKGQVKLMLTAFNIECDLLIGKLGPGNYARTLERIVKMANRLEKSAVTLHCGFNPQYIEYKFQECELQYQFKMKKREEKATQGRMREQTGEAQAAMEVHERPVSGVEIEERFYPDLVEKVKGQLQQASE